MSENDFEEKYSDINIDNININDGIPLNDQMLTKCSIVKYKNAFICLYKTINFLYLF